MQKEKMTILLVDRPIKETEKVFRDIIKKYLNLPRLNIHMIVFPPKENDHEKPIEMVLDSYNLLSELKNHLDFKLPQYDDEEEIYDADVYGIEFDVFIEILETHYELNVLELSSFEKTL